MRIKVGLVKYLVLLCAIFVSSLISCNALAINLDSFSTVKFPSGREDEFSENNIIFYNPEARAGCPTGNITVTGSTASEKVWSALTSVGFTEEQAAGIMGNMMHEGNNFNPVQHEVALMNKHWNNGAFDLGANADVSYGLGLIQWSWGRRVGMYNYIKAQDSSLLDYFNQPETYSNGYSINGDKFLELAGEEVYDAFIVHEIQYLWDEMNSNSVYKGILSKTTVYDAAKFFLEKVEVPKNPYIESHPERATDAQSWYDLYANGKFSGSVSSSSGSSGSNDGSNVTIIGDSIMNAAKSEVQKVLPKAEFLSVQDGKKFSGEDSSNPSGLSVLNDATSVRKVLVFALGSNGGVSEEKINDVITRAKEIGAKKIVFVTLYSRGSKDYTASNTLFKAKAGTDIILMDWEAAVSGDPEKYIRVDSDGVDVHPTSPDGTELYASTLVKTLSGVDTSSKCGPTGDVAALQEKTKAYAWPQHHSAPYPDQMPDYAEAVKSAWYIGGCGGNDCGGFVTTLVRDSGWDDGYNPSKCGTSCQIEYLRSSEKWTDVTNELSSEDDLEPGDVLIINTSEHGHTLIYVGEISGFDSHFASASYAGEGNSCTTGKYARSPMADSGSFDYYKSYDGGNYHFFRKTNN